MSQGSTWVQLSKDELGLISGAMGLLTVQTAQDLKARIEERLADMNNPAQVDVWNQYRNAVSTGDDVDADAVVSEGDDPGAYVMSWIWVTDEEAGFPDQDEYEEEPAECDACGRPHDDPFAMPGQLCDDCEDQADLDRLDADKEAADDEDQA